MKTIRSIFAVMFLGVLCACVDPNAANRYATAQADATAVAQLTEITRAPVPGNSLLYGPLDGEIRHKVGWFEGPEMLLKDFSAGAHFFNPTAAQGSFWEYGFAFRGQDGIWMYLILDSDTNWSLVCMTADVSTPVGHGVVSTMNLGAGESNTVVVGASGSEGVLYVNQQRIATLDLSCSDGNAGKVSLTSGWASGAPIPNGVTLFAQFSIGEFSDITTLVNTLQSQSAVHQPAKTPTPNTNGYLYGPVDGEISHDDGYRRTNVNTRDFYTEVNFHNPADGAKAGWFYGIFFRDSGNTWMYLAFRNDAAWELYCQKDGNDKGVIASGRLDSMNIGADKANRLILVANGRDGGFSFNDEWVSELDFSCVEGAGEIALTAGWRRGSESPNGITRFSNFYISNEIEDFVSRPTQTAPDSPPKVSVSQNTNCRLGPSKWYDHRYDMKVGDVAEIVGRSADGEYWVINRPDGRGQCWLWDEYATVTGDTGKVPVMTPPPPPVITPQINVTVGPLSNGQCPITITGKNFLANTLGTIWLNPCPGGLCGDDDLRSFPDYTTNASGEFSITVYEEQDFFKLGNLWVDVYYEVDSTMPILSKTLKVECK